MVRCGLSARFWCVYVLNICWVIASRVRREPPSNWLWQRPAMRCSARSACVDDSSWPAKPLASPMPMLPATPPSPAQRAASENTSIENQSLLRRIAVFGEDDRGPVPAELHEARDKIGLLYNGKAQIVCTAFCVAPDVIATAAHCLFRTADDRPPALADFVFARSRNQVEGASRIAGFATKSISQNIVSGNMQIRVRPPIDAASDWALIRLSMPGCKSSLAIKAMTNEEIAQAAQANQVFQLSYHRDYDNWEIGLLETVRSGPVVRRCVARHDRQGFHQSAGLDLAPLRHGRSIVRFAAAAGRSWWSFRDWHQCRHLCLVADADARQRFGATFAPGRDRQHGRQCLSLPAADCGAAGCQYPAGASGDPPFAATAWAICITMRDRSTVLTARCFARPSRISS